MLIGMVCPYSLDGPGGVRNQVLGLAEYMVRQGHQVRVIAPGTRRAGLPGYVECTGRSIAVRYNGAVAHLQFGPVAALRIRRWLRSNRFDVVHLHEPAVPSLGLLALLAAAPGLPVVATMHTVNPRSRAMLAARWWLRRVLSRLVVRIAVSEQARQTLRDHLGLEARVIPNGLPVGAFAGAEPAQRWAGTARQPTVGMVGRLDDPRKGLAVLARAWPRIRARVPGARLLLLGPGQAAGVRGLAGVELLGSLPDPDKARLLRSVDVYVAPHTGRESFGIVLAEAMGAGAAVVASNLPAFARVLDGGSAGVLVPPGDPVALSEAVLSLLADPVRRSELSTAARKAAESYSWERVGAAVLSVYEGVLGTVPGG